MNLKVAGIFVFLFLCVIAGFSQLDNSSLLFNAVNDTSKEKAVYLKIQNLNYLKNNEYYNAIADGYTMFGVQLNPQIGYQLSKNLSLEGGIFLNKDFGNNDFTMVQPSFAVRYMKKDFKMVFGNIDGSLNHNLIEPVYNFERVMTNRLESGAQFVVTKKYFDFDTWVDWQRATYRFSNQQENIWAGISANVLKLKTDKADFKIPLQATVYHMGGQLDTLSAGIVKNFNYSAGFLFHYHVKTKRVQSVFADVRYVIRTNNYLDSVARTSQGDGILANVGFVTPRAFNVMLSYWYGNDFYTDLGGFLYSSKSSTVAYSWYWREKYRSLLILRLTKTIKLEDQTLLTLRAEPHYDFINNYFEFSFGFYISLDKKFWLSK